MFISYHIVHRQFNIDQRAIFKFSCGQQQEHPAATQLDAVFEDQKVWFSILVSLAERLFPGA